jgi:hypothetical protein
MNIDKLTDKEFSKLIAALKYHYDGRLPRDVMSALFVKVADDDDHFALGLKKRIDRGITKIDKIIGTSDS